MEKTMMLNYYLLNVVKGENAARLMYAFSVLMNFGNEARVADLNVLLDEKMMNLLIERGYIYINPSNGNFVSLGNAWFNTMEKAEKYFEEKFPNIITVF